MKRSIIFILPLLFVFFGANAQRFRVGIFGGVNVTDVDGVDLTDNDNDFHKFGLTAGGFVNTHLGPKNIFQMEISYSQKGSSQSPDTSQANFNNNNYYRLRLNYVDVVLAIRHRIHLNISKKPTNKFDIEGGASIGTLVFHDYEVKSIFYTMNVNTADVSLFVGAVYNFTPNICFDFRYYNSVLPVIPPDAANSYFLYYGSWNRGHNLVFQGTFKITFGHDPTAENPDVPAPPPPTPADQPQN